jgi:DNA-directed RNA polymerase subunit RPC12/RpoP
MLAKGCPGARTIREARPEYVACPHCGQETELWSDEPVARCPHCRGRVAREGGASCLDWCASAAVCVGMERYRRVRGGQGE